MYFNHGTLEIAGLLPAQSAALLISDVPTGRCPIPVSPF